MSKDSSLERLFNITDGGPVNKQNTSYYTLEEQMESANSVDSEDDLLSIMSPEPAKRLYDKLMPESLDEEPEDKVEEKEEIVLQRPEEVPIDENETFNEEDDVNEEIIKPKRGRKRKEKVNTTKESVTNTIFDVLADDLLKELIKQKYKFHGFSAEDTKLIIKYINSKLKGE